MTENEKEIDVAIEHLKARNMSAKHIDMAIQALEEIQQYRTIGLTPSMVKDLIKSCKKHEKNALENAHIVDDYREIGTVEEFKALKEKNVAKKAIAVDSGVYDYPYDYECPNCRENVDELDHHCNCGQALDWQ